MSSIIFEMGHAPVIVPDVEPTIVSVDMLDDGIVMTLDDSVIYDVFWANCQKNIVCIDNHDADRSDTICVTNGRKMAIEAALVEFGNRTSQVICAHWDGDYLQAITDSNGLSMDNFADITLYGILISSPNYKTNCY